MTTFATRFDRRIDNTPADWRGPTVDVIDTATAVRMALEDWGVENPAATCPELLLGLTQLVLARHDAECKPEVNG